MEEGKTPPGTHLLATFAFPLPFIHCWRIVFVHKSFVTAPISQSVREAKFFPVLQKLEILFKSTQDWENFFGFDFEFYTVSLLVMLKYEGFVTNNFWLAHYGGRYDYSA
jgi:hypothetical protein